MGVLGPFQNCTVRALDFNLLRGDPLGLTHHARATEVADEKSRDREARVSFVVAATAIDDQQRDREDKDPEEHLGQAGQDLVISIDTVPQNDVRLIKILVRSFQIQFIKHDLAQRLLERFLFLRAAADELAAATDLVPADGLSQWVPVLDVLDGVADDRTGHLYLWWVLGFATATLD